MVAKAATVVKGTGKKKSTRGGKKRRKKVEVVNMDGVEGMVGKVAMVDGEEALVGVDGLVWHRVNAFGATVVVPLGPRRLAERYADGEDVDVAALMEADPDLKWKVPREVLRQWAYEMLAWDTEVQCVYGVNQKTGEWLGVVPKQKCTSVECETDDYGPALMVLMTGGYRKVGMIHTHPHSPGCSGVDTGAELWGGENGFGGIHIIVGKNKEVKFYFVAGGMTWELDEGGWEEEKLVRDSVKGEKLWMGTKHAVCKKKGQYTVWEGVISEARKEPEKGFLVAEDGKKDINRVIIRKAGYVGAVGKHQKGGNKASYSDGKWSHGKWRRKIGQSELVWDFKKQAWVREEEKELGMEWKKSDTCWYWETCKIGSNDYCPGCFDNYANLAVKMTTEEKVKTDKTPLKPGERARWEEEVEELMEERAEKLGSTAELIGDDLMSRWQRFVDAIELEQDSDTQWKTKSKLGSMGWPLVWAIRDLRMLNERVQELCTELCPATGESETLRTLERFEVGLRILFGDIGVKPEAPKPLTEREIETGV
jgi:hypothetical protein